MRYLKDETREILFRNGRATVYDRNPDTGDLYSSRRSKETLGFLEKFKEHTDQGMILYALTVTYTQHDQYDDIYGSIKNRFHHLYWDRFLPKVFFGTKRWLKHYSHVQPKIYVFTEEHEARAQTHASSIGVKKTTHSDELHHHAVMFIEPEYQQVMDQLIGENTLKHLSTGVMTTYLEQCDLGWALYSLKDYDKNKSKYEYFQYGPIEKNEQRNS